MRLLLLAAAAAITNALDVQDVAYAVITSSPVAKDRLPPLEDAWITPARARGVTVLVVSDACDDRNCVAVACEASQAGVPCKSGRAFVELRRRTTAKWLARVMDDTFVDVDALAWHLAVYDETKPYYVGDMAIAYADQEERFRFAWGGAGWALSEPAAELTEQLLDFYFYLVETTGCPAQTCNANMSWPAHYHSGGRGLRLNNAYADDVVFGLFMSALNVAAEGPAGFQQTPLDILGGAPPCSSTEMEAARVRETTCVSGATGRVHALGGFFDEDRRPRRPSSMLWSPRWRGGAARWRGGSPVHIHTVAQTARAVATSGCRGAQRPASIHLGEETGGPLNKLWRAQLPSLVKAFRGRTLASVPRGSPFHYGRLCVVEGAPIPPTELVEMPAPLPLPFESGGVQDSIPVGACDDPDEIASRACGALGRADDACVDQMRAMAMRLRDALWNHRRPVSAEVTLGDGSTTTVVVEAGEDATAVVAAACREHDIAPHDCATLKDWLAARSKLSVMCESN